MRLRRWLPWLLVVGACAAQNAGDVQPTITLETPIEQELTTPPTTPMAPPAGVDVLVATTAAEFDDISEALTTAAERWAAAAPQTYAYRMRVDCECDDRGEGGDMLAVDGVEDVIATYVR
jgi:hypothetical protein